MNMMTMTTEALVSRSLCRHMFSAGVSAGRMRDGALPKCRAGVQTATHDTHLADEMVAEDEVVKVLEQEKQRVPEKATRVCRDDDVRQECTAPEEPQSAPVRCRKARHLRIRLAIYLSVCSWRT